jgi:hypothetical protein
LVPAVIVCELGVADRLKSGAGFTVSVALVVWLRLPLVAVIVRVDVPTGVEELVCIVTVEAPAPAIGFAANVAVAFAGNPLMLKLIFPLKPLITEVDTVKVAAPPAAIPEDCGVTEMEKSGIAFTTRFTLMLWVRFPLAPVICNTVVPPGVEDEVFTVKVEDPEPVTELGLKLAVAPVGSPARLKFTVPVKPFKGEMDTVYVVPAPGITVCEPGETAIVKSGTFTVKVILAL